MRWIAALEPVAHERRFVRFAAPTLQLRLALVVFGVTAVFALLIGLNSYAAYGRLMDGALSVAGEAFRSELALQTAQYAVVTATLLLGYALALVAACAAMVDRIAGPVVALERHVRLLKAGDYRSRVRLRNGGSVHADLARQLNELAEHLGDRR